MSKVIDGVIKEWGDRLYYSSVKPRKGNNIRNGVLPLPCSPRPKNVSYLNDCLVRTVDRVPEVMVKISGGGKNMGSIKAHIAYISRNGSIELEDEKGQLSMGKDGIQEVCVAWAKGRIGIPNDGEKRREAFNIILSMPPGTDRQSVKEAARDFAIEQFKKHQYVFVAHDDEKHPHVHVAVKAVDCEGRRLNPRKSDLQLWRESFAEKLRDHGIMANATPRRARGITHKSEKQFTRHMKSKLAISFQEKTRQVERSGKNINFANSPLKTYGDLARLLVCQGESNRQLALKIVRFIQEMPSIPNKNKQLFSERNLVNSGSNLEK